MHLFYALFEYSLPFWNCWDLINVFTHSSSLEHTHMVGCQEGSQECGSLLIWPQLNMKASPLDYMMALEQERNQKMHRAGSKASYTSYQKAEKKKPTNKQQVVELVLLCPDPCLSCNPAFTLVAFMGSQGCSQDTPKAWCERRGGLLRYLFTDKEGWALNQCPHQPGQLLSNRLGPKDQI